MDIVARSKALMMQMGAAPVMYLMIALSVITLGIAIERVYFFRRTRADLPKLMSELGELLSRDDLAAAQKLLAASPSAEAAVVLAGLAQGRRGARAAAQAMEGALALQRVRLDQNLAFLGTVGNNAPFVGLFGTVIGIVMAFDRLGKAANAGSVSTDVMGSIAEALVATAIGLLVAIPAVALYNAFQRHIRLVGANTEALSKVLLAHLEGEGQPPLSERSPSRRMKPHAEAAHPVIAPQAS